MNLKLSGGNQSEFPHSHNLIGHCLCLKAKSYIQHNYTSSNCPNPKPSDIGTDCTKTQTQLQPHEDGKSETDSTQLCPSAETDL